MIEGSLHAYLDDVGRRGFRLGDLDCAAFMAGWLMRCGFPDAMADRRAAYASLSEVRRLLMSEGGMVAACHRRFSRLGLRVATTPRAGDVAVLMLPYARRRGQWLRRATGAIAVSDRSFAVLAPTRMLITSASPVAKIWSADA